MFFYILLHGPVTRDGIGVIFWPDSAPQKVASCFHNALYHIRSAVGDIGYWFDVEEFEGLVRQARLLQSQDRQAERLWERAVSLYRGDFLPEVERVWCVPRREMLREMYVEALMGMGQYHAGRDQLEEALAWYRRALEVDGLRENGPFWALAAQMYFGPFSSESPMGSG